MRRGGREGGGELASSCIKMFFSNTWTGLKGILKVRYFTLLRFVNHALKAWREKMEAKEKERERGRKGREGQSEWGGGGVRRVWEDLWPCSPGLVTRCNWPPEWDPRVWSPQPRDQSNGNSTFVHCYSTTSAGHKLKSHSKFLPNLELKLIIGHQLSSKIFPS